MTVRIYVASSVVVIDRIDRHGRNILGRNKRRPAGPTAPQRPAWKRSVVRVIQRKGRFDFVQIRHAPRIPRFGTGYINGRDDNRRQYADDGNDDQKLYECEPPPAYFSYGFILALFGNSPTVLFVFFDFFEFDFLFLAVFQDYDFFIPTEFVARLRYDGRFV